ncbi:MAG: hypothetical protein D6798_08900 [Deltaproteobacteria bacterium]|nr:MAG: hypothetical protein D6798_08900 [Deltaproteobacteria bacterium]
MPFSWNTRPTDAARAAAQADRARVEHLAEARERAALLRRLGWPRDHALRRVVANHAWETTETGGPFLTEAELTDAVDAAYKVT